MRFLVSAIAAMVLGGCESLPHDGPSARQVQEQATPAGPYALVDLDYRIAQLVAASPPPARRGLAEATSSAPSDLIGEGDVISVSIYTPPAGPSARSQDDSQKDQTLSIPRLVVDRNGEVQTPYAGSVRVQGLTPKQAATAIQSHPTVPARCA